MPFEYRPLDPAAHEIRVLDVSAPASPNDPVTCEIRHVSLDLEPPPHYEAISYRWGDATCCSRILINGTSINVPRNTELALRRGAAVHHNITLWVDAVCINQDDLQERQHQVAMMGKVYSLCQRALVYLGEEENLTHRALGNISAISQEIRRSLDGQKPFRDLVMSGWRWQRAESPGETLVDVKALVQFYSQPWFGRVWVIQEVVLAPEAKALCGKLEMCLNDALECAAFLYHHEKHIAPVLYDCAGWYRAVDIWLIADARSRGFSELGDLLARSRDFKAHDPRDRVFGMLGMHPYDSNKWGSHLLAVDYRKPLPEVLRDAVRFAMLTASNNHLDLLKAVSHRGEASLQAEGWPSWVPRLDLGFELEVDPVGLNHPGRQLNYGHIDHELIEPADSPNILRLRGVSFDTIVEASDVRDTQLCQNFNKLLAWLQTLERMVAGLDDGNNGLECLARTLFADTNISGNRCEPKDFVGLARLFGYWKKHEWVELPNEIPVDASDMYRRASYAWAAMKNPTHMRRFFKTRNGFVGLGPNIIRSGDSIVILLGNHFPSVLRQHGDSHLFLGNCYVDLIMPWQQPESNLQEILRGFPRKTYCLQ